MILNVSAQLNHECFFFFFIECDDTDGVLLNVCLLCLYLLWRIENSLSVNVSVWVLTSS